MLKNKNVLKSILKIVKKWSIVGFEPASSDAPNLGDRRHM